MRIAILGAGNIGGILGSKWLKAGHEVVFGVCNMNSPKTISALEQATGAKATDVKTAIYESELVLFSLPWKIVPEIARASAADLNNKLIMDATNNFAGPVINNLKTLEEHAHDQRSIVPLIRWVGRCLPILS